MANRGVEWSFDQPVYILERTYADGRKLHKVCLTEKGLGLMLSAAKWEMQHSGGRSYAPQLLTTFSVVCGQPTKIEAWKIDGP